eukprot:UN30608
MNFGIGIYLFIVPVSNMESTAKNGPMVILLILSFLMIVTTAMSLVWYNFLWMDPEDFNACVKLAYEEKLRKWKEENQEDDSDDGAPDEQADYGSDTSAICTESDSNLEMEQKKYLDDKFDRIPGGGRDSTDEDFQDDDEEAIDDDDDDPDNRGALEFDDLSEDDDH